MADYPSFENRYSAILFATAIRDNSSQDIIRVYSVELDPLIASIAMNFISLAGLSDIIEVIVGPSDHTLRRLHSEKVLGSGGVDMLFVDHVEKLYKRDVELCESLGLLDKEGSLVVADNVVRPGAPEYREYVRNNPRFSKSWGVSGLIVPGDIPVRIYIPICAPILLTKSYERMNWRSVKLAASPIKVLFTRKIDERTIKHLAMVLL